MNYNGTFSVMLVAFVDNNYHFIFVNIGCQGRISDGHVFLKYHFTEQTELKTTEVPTRSTTAPVQFVFMGDYAITLHAHTHTHTHTSNEKIPQKLQEECRKTSRSSSTYLPGHYKCFWHNGLSFMSQETNVTSTTYGFKYCHNLHFTTQFVKNKHNHTIKVVTSRCTQ
jgi:hypothetical protein